MKKVNIYEYRDNKRLLCDRQMYKNKIIILQNERINLDFFEDHERIEHINILITDCFRSIVKIDDVLLNRYV